MLVCAYCEGCSNTNATSSITFFTYMLQQTVIRFPKELYAAFKLAPDRKKKYIILYLSSYNPLNEGHSSTLTN